MFTLNHFHYSKQALEKYQWNYRGVFHCFLKKIIQGEIQPGLNVFSHLFSRFLPSFSAKLGHCLAGPQPSPTMTQSPTLSGEIHFLPCLYLGPPCVLHTHLLGHLPVSCVIIVSVLSY